MRIKILSFMLIVALAAVAFFPATDATAQDPANTLTLEKIGEFSTDTFLEGTAEISAWDAGSQRLFITNGLDDTVDILDISDPTAPVRVAQVPVEPYGAGLNSVAAYNGVVAVAIEAEEIDANGVILFMDTDGNEISTVEAGVLPDMVTFTPDGNVVLVANEGEPNDDYTIDPEGSVTIIDVSGGFEMPAATQVTFEQFNDMEIEGARIFGPGATVAQDLEPEYIVVSPDSSTAFVFAQENNALIVVDIAAGEATAILGLGYKDHSLEGNGFDASNEDGEINITTHPTLGMYQPDGAAAYEVDGTVYLVTANEGDARDYDGFSEEVRVADLTLDAEAYPDAEELQMDENLGRLRTTNVTGDTDGDGDIDQIYSYGARSFTIWNASTGEIVFDSGDDFEQISAVVNPELFNANGDELTFEDRSDDKGPEPEGITLGTIGERTYAFVGFERSYGFIIYDITDPANPVFDQFIPTRTNELNDAGNPAGDIGPEGLLFIPAEESPNGENLLVITYEVSDNTVIYQVNADMMGEME
jgi:hypothetical protein